MSSDICFADLLMGSFFMSGIQGIRKLVLFTPVSKIGSGTQQIFANGMNEEKMEE